MLPSLGAGRFFVRQVTHEDGTEVQIEIVQMQHSCRIVEKPVEDLRASGRHWCYQSFLAAVAAAHIWSGGETTEPPGYWRRGGAPLALTWVRAGD